MAEDERCECCDLPVISCGRRRPGDDGLAVSESAKLWWAARYPGRCARCLARFAEGDQITRDDVTNLYLCEDCGA